MKQVSRDSLKSARDSFWKAKEMQRLQGNAWIMRHGTDSEKRELMERAR